MLYSNAPATTTPPSPENKFYKHTSHAISRSNAFRMVASQCKYAVFNLADDFTSGAFFESSVMGLQSGLGSHGEWTPKHACVKNCLAHITLFELTIIIISYLRLILFQFNRDVNVPDEHSPFPLLKVAISFAGSRHAYENVVCIYKKPSFVCHHILVTFGTFEH